jgi:hypothetical protein
MPSMSKPSRPTTRKSLRAAKIVALLVPLALLLAAPPARAADGPLPDEDVFRSNTNEVLQGAAALAGAGCQGGHGTALVLGLLIQGDRLHLWKLEQSDKAPELRPNILAKVKDSTGVLVDDGAFEPEAYCEALLKASLTSPGAFANSARRDVTFAHLFNEPWRYRGQVIHFEGQVRRIRRFDPPGMVEAKGVKDLYECWLFDTHYGANPVCLVCTELPEGVAPGERLNLAASFDAYFFKKYRYKAADSTEGHAREAPLFIGRSFVVSQAPSLPVDDAYGAGWKGVLVLFLGGVLATFVLAFGLHWWFRRNDRRVGARINEVRPRDYVDPGAPGLPGGATPSAN